MLVHVYPCHKDTDLYEGKKVQSHCQDIRPVFPAHVYCRPPPQTASLHPPPVDSMREWTAGLLTYNGRHHLQPVAGAVGVLNTGSCSYAAAAPPPFLLHRLPNRGVGADGGALLLLLLDAVDVSWVPALKVAGDVGEVVCRVAEVSRLQLRDYLGRTGGRERQGREGETGER